MNTIVVTAEDTLDIVSDTLQKHFPSTIFALRLEDPVIEKEGICGADIVWIEGPSRDQIEDLLDPFQSVNWDPATGKFRGRAHLAVDEDGELIQIVYNIDYLFCDGPSIAMNEL